MAGLTYNKPLPVVPGYDPAKDTWCKDGKIQFESGRYTRGEDQVRRELMLGTIKQYPDCIDVDAAWDLAARLEPDPRARTPPETLASSEFFREIRRGLTSQNWANIAHAGVEKAYVAHLRPIGIQIAAADLPALKPRERLLHPLQVEFDRAGITAADGFLTVGLHGEFDSRRQIYDLHFHLSGHGDKIEALEALRGLDRYQWTPGGFLPDGRKQAARLVKPRLKPEQLPDRLTYTLQSYWPHSPTGKFGGSDTMRRKHRAGRIPEPFHTQWLLWLDRQNVSDLMFTQGLKLTSGGLQPVGGVYR